MKRKHFLIILFSSTLIAILIISVFLQTNIFSRDQLKGNDPEVFVGIDVAYADLPAIQKLVDEISHYTNLFVIGCTEIVGNATKLNETCQYIYDKGLSFVFYTWTPRQPSQQWLKKAKDKWGDRFLGLYIYDEVGGKQLDGYMNGTVQEANNYTDAKNQYVTTLNNNLNYVSGQPNSMDLSLFTSDYALYWFDYEAGYDAVLAQFGWNYSRQLNVALCRGTATVLDKKWGVIITWTYTHPPYIGSGPELYRDLVLAYENGAKYIVVFDSDKNYSRGILEEEHLEALKEFWEYANNSPRTSDDLSVRVAYVLPKDYGHGFRGPNDKIWGLWEADTFSSELCKNISSLFEEYGIKLDIIYDDGLELNDTYGYSKLIFWNGTTWIP